MDLREKITPKLDAMAARGLKVDITGLNDFRQTCLGNLDEIGKYLLEQGIDTPGSRKQVDAVTGCGMQQEKAILLKRNDPILTKVIEWRGWQREASYALSFLKQLRGDRVHWTWENAASGRLYTKEYNVQQISASARMFVEPDHGRFACMDYRQSEVRVAAAMSGDKKLQEDITSGDVYTILANEYFSSVKNSREAVKVMVLGIFYGMNEQGISKRLDIPVKVAVSIHNDIMRRYSRLAAWIDELHKTAKDAGKISTLSGFTRIMDEPDFEKRMRQAVNTTVQGSMADVLKMAVDKWEPKPGIELVCLVHDSLVFDYDPTDPNAVAQLLAVQKEMEFDLAGVKMELKVKTGETWGDVTDEKPLYVETRI